MNRTKIHRSFYRRSLRYTGAVKNLLPRNSDSNAFAELNRHTLRTLILLRHQSYGYQNILFAIKVIETFTLPLMPVIRENSALRSEFVNKLLFEKFVIWQNKICLK